MSGRRRARDETLFALPAGRRGRVESAVDRAVRQARADGLLSALDVALITLARSQARAVDVAEGARDVWALSRAGGELRESLIRLRLDPTSRGATRDSLADFLRSLADPAPGDGTGPPAVAHTPDP